VITIRYCAHRTVDPRAPSEMVEGNAMALSSRSEPTETRPESRSRDKADCERREARRQDLCEKQVHS
jgi:hypothetical protein